jgi:hypothetical protein
MNINEKSGPITLSAKLVGLVVANGTLQPAQVAWRKQPTRPMEKLFIRVKSGRGATTGQKLRGTIMASAGARAYMGVWGLCPQWGPGAKPLVRGSGAKPPEAEAYITIAGVNFCLKITAEQ